MMVSLITPLADLVERRLRRPRPLGFRLALGGPPSSTPADLALPDMRRTQSSVRVRPYPQ